MLKVDKLSKDFGDKIVLKDIDLEINEGEMLAVVGSSGCGKSTFLNIIGLLEPRTSGDLEVFGFKNVKPFSKRANKLSTINSIPTRLIQQYITNSINN